MLIRKRYYFLALFFCLALTRASAGIIDTAYVTRLLKGEERQANDGDLARYLNNYFIAAPLNDVATARTYIGPILKKYRKREGPAFEYFISGIIQKRLLHYDKAKKSFDNAIVIAEKTGNHYLLFSLHSNQAFIWASQGNSAEAMDNYRLAQKEATALNDINRHILLAINISDLYYKNNLFKQSLQYLDQAEAMNNAAKSKKFHHENFIYLNKAEIYFRLNNLDSLKKYHRLLFSPDRASTGIYEFRKRVSYLLTIAGGSYIKAIDEINTLKTDKKYPFWNEDLIYLADAYYKADMNDSAKVTINSILGSIGKNDNPFLKYHLHEILGQIDMKNADTISAAKNFAIALAEFQTHTDRMVQVANISSQMKIDQIAEDFIRKEEQYKRQRLMLIFAVVVFALLVGIIIMFYRNIKQKHYYEQLLYKAKHHELAFINSHEVRRHLSNILGLVGLLQDKGLTKAEADQITGNLDHSAQSLDSAIKNISEKLDN
ncbi:hypothetical protein LJ707_01720 [Mucilaginibacter sp. UR6-1]|uniref:hypothetical protein n=1 Tax=Mucilaginibacter sp. UR6-1 TaxID=1435643 RepID=UPI001E2CEBC4|nr:hypothetical protein [Mucilaginibacter sp. UR6-1]MCC8407630.1 hypothetical protein [Mucilaginibacter sp. UR6-1]